mmetsp:Transcript_103464/g.309098  ORF Transcript_103464/g.309098 Transcript_103464/m.309098 type:complete len:269 (+) Transcript_103464:140-946(+)
MQCSAPRHSGTRLSRALLGLRPVLLAHRRGLLQQRLHHLGVGHDLRSLDDLRQSALVARELGDDLLPHLGEAELLADCQALDDVARRQILRQPARRTLGEARQLEVLREPEHVLVDLWCLGAVVLPHPGLDLVDVVQHIPHGLWAGDVRHLHLLLAAVSERRSRKALGEDLAPGAQHSAVSPEAVTVWDLQDDVAKLPLLVELPDALTQDVRLRALRCRQPDYKIHRLGAELRHLLQRHEANNSCQARGGQCETEAAGQSRRLWLPMA